MYLYTCSEFNVAQRKCMAYGGRPGICRKFICGPATVGEIPVAEHMTAHPNKVEGMGAKYKLQDKANARKRSPVRLSRADPGPRPQEVWSEVAHTLRPERDQVVAGHPDGNIQGSHGAHQCTPGLDSGVALDAGGSKEQGGLS